MSSYKQWDTKDHEMYAKEEIENQWEQLVWMMELLSMGK